MHDLDNMLAIGFGVVSLKISDLKFIAFEKKHYLDIVLQ